MMNFFFILMFICIISTLLFSINLLISKKLINREKKIPIECGFKPINKMNLPFSIQFYFISILFLIFDIEISLMLPIIQKIKFVIINKWMISFLAIIIILLMGLYMEWINNLIKWY